VTILSDKKRNSLIDEFFQKRKVYENIKEYNDILDNLEYYSVFLDNLGKNSYEPYISVSIFNDYVPNYDFNSGNPLAPILEFLKTIKKAHVINLASIFDSLRSTLYSIHRTMEVINISDSFALLRKFKDDYLLAIFFSLLGNSNHENSGVSFEKWNEKIDTVFKFAQNSMNDLKSVEAVSFITSNPDIKELDKLIGIKSKFKEMTDLMNKYMHSHGLLFLNNTNPKRHLDSTIDMIKVFNKYLDTIMTYLTCIIIYLNPRLIVPHEYFRNMDTNDSLSEKTHRCTATYLKEFIDDRVQVVEPKLYDFLMKKFYF